MSKIKEGNIIFCISQWLLIQCNTDIRSHLNNPSVQSKTFVCSNSTLMLMDIISDIIFLKKHKETSILHLHNNAKQ